MRRQCAQSYSAPGISKKNSKFHAGSWPSKECHDSERHPVGILQLTGAQGGVEKNMEATIGFRVQRLGLHKDYKKRLSGKDHGSYKSSSSRDLGFYRPHQAERKRKRKFHKGLRLRLSVADILREKKRGAKSKSHGSYCGI